MATEVTPSKKVPCYRLDNQSSDQFDTDYAILQAASAIQGLKMTDSPAKKLDFSIANKENCAVAVPIAGIPDIPQAEEKTTDAPSIAPTIKPEEATEPLLQENPQRFVLFPIQNHEVSDMLSRSRQTRKVLQHVVALTHE